MKIDRAVKTLIFITGNKTKFNEVQAILAPIKLKQLNIDLHEIQEIDPRKIIEHKLQEALKRHKGEFIIDDSSLFLSCFNYKLPGPLIKWFNTTIGTQGIFHLCKKINDFKAKAITIIGYAKQNGDIIFFEGEVKGRISAPRGKYNFGYDPIFVPDGSKNTLSEMKALGNFGSSPRGVAVKKLKIYLNKINV
jgi:inosine triphosphate pyrophosphatase